MNVFGDRFKVSIYGESHGKGVGIVIDGCPSGIELKEEDLLEDLARRKAGGAGTTKRIEGDLPNIISGVVDGKTSGAPINIYFENTNVRSKDYSMFRKVPRPGHSDFVAEVKYDGYNDIRGGGHFSGRLTLGLVAAGVVAKKVLKGVKVESKLVEAGGVNISKYTKEQMDLYMERIQEEGDSIGGVIKTSVEGVEVGLGDPFFGSVESHISKMIFSVPAVKGIEFGAGFRGCKLRGSEHNDLIVSADGKTSTNNNGGINGGITNGNNIEFNVGIKPTASIFIPQETYNFESGKVEAFQINGRHDSCIARRASVVIENATAIAVADLYLIRNGYKR